MSKPIRLTNDMMDECRRDFEKTLETAKLSNGRVTFSKTFDCGSRTATIWFSAEAWDKMTMLLCNFDKEVAWHGVARRSDDVNADEYIVDDIVVYPQEVTGSTVEMDTEKYAQWLQDNSEDDRFNHIRMQGHSHVNMGTTPSSVDLTHQEEIVEMLGDDDFYIFMIYNKSFDSTNKIYDIRKNVMFENKDITVKIVGQTEGLNEFVRNAKSMVRTKSHGNGRAVKYYETENAKPSYKYSDVNMKPATTAAPRIGAGWRGREYDDKYYATENFGGKRYD